MSRTGWSTSNFLRGAVPVSAMPLTMAAWAYSSVSAATKQNILGLYTSSATADINMFSLALDASNVAFTAANGASGSQAFTSAGPSTNTWFHVAGVATSATSRAVYFNGGSKGTDTNSKTPFGMDRFTLGKRDNVSNDRPFAGGGTGYLADVALWNVALTDAEVLSLARGYSPLLVRPSALVFYSPLFGTGTTEPNLFDAVNELAIQGTLTAGPHPPIIMPRHKLIIP